MLGDLMGAKSVKHICDISKATERELDMLIVISVEAVEEIAKNIDS